MEEPIWKTCQSRKAQSRNDQSDNARHWQMERLPDIHLHYAIVMALKPEEGIFRRRWETANAPK